MRADIATISGGLRAPSIFSEWVLMAPAVALRIAGGGFSYGAYAFLVLHAARGLPQAIQAIFLSWLFASLNTALFPQSPEIEILRVLIIFAAAVRVFLRALDLRGSAFLSRSVTVPLFLFIAMCGANSMLVSPLPEISILKTVLFGLTSLCLLGAWEMLGPLRERMEAWVFHALTVVAALSALLALSGRGYEVNETGFQGILNQPQAYGIVMALLLTWQLGLMLQGRLFSRLQVLRSAFFGVLLVATLSRTSLLAFAIATLCAGLISLFSHRSELRLVLRNLGHPVLISLAGLVAMLAIPYSQLAVTGLEMLALKGDVDTTLEAGFQTSRGVLIDQSIDNFLESPYFGNGFAVPTYLESDNIRYDPTFGLPVSAPIEKGVLPIAVLEEVGVVGAFFFWLFIYFLLRDVAQRGSYRMIGLLVCALAVNLGEAVLLSPSGMGLLIWVIIGMATAPNAGLTSTM